MAGASSWAFRQVWPRWLMIIMGLVEAACVLVMFVTELGNVASNFWYTNVFAGGWCGCVMFVHFISLFVVGCCAPSPTVGLIVAIVTLVGMIACAAMISFDIVFLVKPSTCILTSSCASNAASMTLFSYYFREGFFVAFHKLSAFETYSETQAKFLFQVVQASVGGLCFILGIVYLIVFIVAKFRANKVAPCGQTQPYAGSRSSYPPATSNYYQRGYPGHPSVPEATY